MSSSPRSHRRLDRRAVACSLLLGVALALPAVPAGAADPAARSAAPMTVTMTDLGLLGDGARAEAVSDRGVVIGGYQSTFGPGRAFRWEDGVMVDLVDLTGEHGGANQAITDAIAVNVRGQVVGTSTRADGIGTRAVLWEPDGSIVQLETPGSFSTARAINRAGTVAGGMRRPDDELRAVIWRDGLMTDLGDLGAGWSFATAINDAGEVAGVSGDASGEPRAFRWSDGTMTALPAPSTTPPDARTGVVNLNRRGDVLVVALTPHPDEHVEDLQRALLWTRTDVATMIPGLGGAEVRPADLDDRGRVVGAATTVDGALHAFVAQDGEVTDLGTLGGPESHALAINRRGQVVGSADLVPNPFPRYHATLWEDGAVVDLGAIGRVSQAVDINRRGQIAGWSLDANRPECSDVRPRCGEHAMLWTVER